MAKILILDDDAKIAKALAVRCRAAGHETLVALDPDMGTLLASTRAPDLIIADIFMPVMQGPDFIRSLNRLGLPRTPFIFITASLRDGLWEEAMRLGAVGYFEKPYDPERLLAKVAETLDKKHEKNIDRGR